MFLLSSTYKSEGVAKFNPFMKISWGYGLNPLDHSPIPYQAPERWWWWKRRWRRRRRWWWWWKWWWWWFSWGVEQRPVGGYMSSCYKLLLCIGMRWDVHWFVGLKRWLKLPCSCDEPILQVSHLNRYERYLVVRFRAAVWGWDALGDGLRIASWI